MRDRLTIESGASVERVLVERGRARGVVVDGRELRARAGDRSLRRCLRLAGHPSPVRDRAGGGPARAGRSYFVADRPGVGANLLDHPCVALEFEGSEAFRAALASTPYHPDEQTVGRARSSLCDAGPYDIHVFLVAGANTGHPGLPPISMYGGAMRARSQGRVTLRDADPRSLPLIDHRYLSDPDGHDQQVLTEARDLLERMAADPGLRGAGGRARHARRLRHPRPGRQLLPPRRDVQRRHRRRSRRPGARGRRASTWPTRR